jgi:diguanylate cyclase (GGDEF)-like protein
MSEKLIRVVWAGLPAAPATVPFALEAQGPWGPFTAETAAGLADAATREALAGADALLLYLPSGQQATPVAWPALSSACADVAVMVCTDEIDPTTHQRLLTTGVQDVVLATDAASLTQRVRLSVERWRLAQEARKAYATDLSTGLPNRQQLLEHMSQLLALREREPKPVSLLVLRVDGLQGVESGHGQESANVVRRKVAVRLRAGVRASDVVASLGVDVFAVLLPSTETAEDAQHVVDKLMRSVREPFRLAGNSVGVSAHVGVAHFPQDGKQPEELLRHASAAALLGAYGLQDAAND